MTKVEYLLQCLQEEAAEIVCAASKCNRFTPKEVWGNGDKNPKRLSNIERLRIEVIDLLALLDMLEEEGINIKPTPRDVEALELKREKVLTYMKYSRDVGALTLYPYNDNSQ